MVRAIVDGELAWARRDHQGAVRSFRAAVEQGSAYARVRLGWLLVTGEGYRNPALALELLEPLRGVGDYQAQSALAAAYAADGRFAPAVGAAERACAVADQTQQGDCAARLARYRSGRTLVPASGQPPGAAGAAPPARSASPPARNAGPTPAR